MVKNRTLLYEEKIKNLELEIKGQKIIPEKCPTNKFIFSRQKTPTSKNEKGKAQWVGGSDGCP